jgi:hypothetical protein
MRCIALALVACFIECACATGCACAAESLTPDGHAYSKLSDSDILQAWSLAHEACLKHTPGACDESDEIDREMPPRGFCYMDDGATARWTKCDGKTVAAAPTPRPPKKAAPPALSGEAAPPDPPREAERQSPSPREAALCEAMRYAMFTSPQAAARAERCATKSSRPPSAGRGTPTVAGASLFPINADGGSPRPAQKTGSGPIPGDNGGSTRPTRGASSAPEAPREATSG